MEQILQRVSSRKSPITGESFTPLTSKDYKKEKKNAGLSAVADLEFSGKMLDSLDYKIDGDDITIGVFGEAAPRADGHNNLSGDSSLPERRFLPGKGEGFVPAIQKQLDRIIADSVAEGADVAPVLNKLQGVSTSTGLYEILGGVFPLASKNDIRLAVLRSDQWTSTLRGLGLLKWL